MIHFIQGKPGGGKSLFGVKKMVEELVEGERRVLTNLPVDVPRLNEYLQQKYPGKLILLRDRLRLLTEEELKLFWEHRYFGTSPTLEH